MKKNLLFIFCLMSYLVNAQKVNVLLKDNLAIEKSFKMSNSSSTLETGLVLYYPFNGNSNDESGNGNNGTVNGATLTPDKAGNANKAYSFDGVNDEISVNASESLKTFCAGDHTYSVWVKLNSTNSVPKFIVDAGGTGAYGDQRGIRLYSSQKPSFKWVTTTSSYEAISSTSLAVGTWYHLVGVLHGNTGDLYVNGVKVATNSSAGTPSSISLIKIGQVSEGGTGDGSFPGVIDEVRIYNRALSEIEINQIFTPVIDHIFLSDLKVFPNPFNSIIYIKSNIELKRIVIFNQLGQSVFENNSQLEFVNTEKLSRGIYTISIVDKKGNTFSFKLLK
jgi:hypothetical protein